MGDLRIGLSEDLQLIYWQANDPKYHIQFDLKEYNNWEKVERTLKYLKRHILLKLNEDEAYMLRINEFFKYPFNGEIISLTEELWKENKKID